MQDCTQERNVVVPEQKPELINLIDVDGGVAAANLTFSEAMAAIKASFEEHGESKVGVEVVHVWLARTHGASEDPTFILQRRSDNHRLDKTVGGHVSAGNTEEKTVELELSEEAGVSAKIMSGLGQGALSGVDLSHDAMIIKTGVDPWQISGRHDRGGTYFEKPTRVHTYIGFFDGDLDTLTSDFEVEGFVAMPFSEIKSQLATQPEDFTPDVAALVYGVAADVQRLAVSAS